MGLEQEIIVKTSNEEEETFNLLLRNIETLQGYFEDRFKVKNAQKVAFDLHDVGELLDITEYILNNRTDVDYIMEELTPQSDFFDGDSMLDEPYFNDVLKINDIMSNLKAQSNIVQLYYVGCY